MRAAILLATALLITVPAVAQAAVTKSTLLACKDESDLRVAVKLRTGGDRKASADFEKGKIGSGSCLIVPSELRHRHRPAQAAAGVHSPIGRIRLLLDDPLCCRRIPDKPLAPKEAPGAKARGK